MFPPQHMEKIPVRLIDFEVSQPVNGKVTAQKGYVLCINPKSDVDPMMDYRIPPELDVDPAAEFDVANGQALFVKVNTDEKDIMTTLSAVVDAADTASQHQQPPPTAAGETAPPPLNGFYYYKIAEFYEEAGVLKTRMVHTGGVIIHRPVLHEFFNLEESSGTRYEVFKSWNAAEARYEIRPVVQLTGGDGVPVLFPLQSGEPPYNAIKVRSLSGKATLPQIRVRTPGGATDTVITIEGNDVDGTAAINFGGHVTVADGLVTEIDEGTLGDDFNLSNYPCIPDPGPAPTAPNWTIYFRKGLAFLADPGGEPSTTLIMYDGFSCTPPDGP